MDNEDKQTLNNRFHLSNIVGSIKSQFHKSFFYDRAIRFSILSGKITDKELAKTAFCEVFPFPQQFVDFELENEQPMVAIFVNNETKKKN
jgi:hypothetical protein